MKIAVLTSSRADFGIYQPLLEKIKADRFFDLEIIAFGTHTSRLHGYTLENIQEAGFEKLHHLVTVLADDGEEAVATSYALTSLKFASFWETHSYDLVFCLGDRFEMNAAVQAGIPFNIRFAHLHGGETTLGAIDNIYRHQISLASSLHFTATEDFSQKVGQVVGTCEGVHTVGSLSLDGLKNLDLPAEKELRTNFKLPSGNFILSTFHPETMSPERNAKLASEMFQGLSKLAPTHSLVITMPNADTYGSAFRQKLLELQSAFSGRVALVENFGKLNYFAAMKYCSILLGNTSSGIIEAASFGKYAVNVGSRQQGRLRSQNVLDCDFTAGAMASTAREAIEKGAYRGRNKYYQAGAAEKIINILKNINHP